MFHVRVQPKNCAVGMGTVGVKKVRGCWLYIFS